MSISPGGENTLDSYAWDYNRSGLYSVKSAYWALQETKIGNKDLCHQPSINPLYQQLWSLDTSPKIHHFLWKCLNNSLAVMGNLAYRHLSKEENCPRCPSHKETVNHMLFTCPLARLVWAESPVPAPWGGEWSNSIFENLHRLFNIKKENKDWEEMGKLGLWIAWRIWKNRNEMIFKGKEFGALQVIEKAHENKLDWSKRCREIQETPRLQRRQRREVKWIKPTETWLKCNSDGAWCKDNNTSGLGWILRNQEGKPLWMGIKAESHLRTAWETEATALRWALLAISRFGYDKVIFEVDSEDLRNRVFEKGDPELSHPLIQDIRKLFSKFAHGRIAFTVREGNRAADRLAKQALSVNHNDPLMYSIVPVWLKFLVTKDICNSQLF